MATKTFKFTPKKIHGKIKSVRFGGITAGSSVSAPFSPSSVTGLQLWLKADALVLNDNDPVSTWTDSSGNGRNATQAGGARPTYKTNIVNGLPVVRFASGSAQNMALPDFATGFSAGEIFVVSKPNSDPPATGNGGLYTFGSDGNSTHYCFTDGIIYDQFGTTARKVTVDPAPSLSAVFRLYNVSSGAGLWTSRLDTVQLFTTGVNTVGFTNAPVVGATVAGGAFLNGDMAEMVLYNSVLSGADRTALQTYFDNKYNLAF